MFKSPSKTATCAGVSQGNLGLGLFTSSESKPWLFSLSFRYENKKKKKENQFKKKKKTWKMAFFLPSDSGEHFKLSLSSIILFIVVIVYTNHFYLRKIFTNYER
jgi:hypothetical protein